MTSVLYDVPGPKAILRNRLVGVGTVIVPLAPPVSETSTLAPGIDGMSKLVGADPPFGCSSSVSRCTRLRLTAWPLRCSHSVMRRLPRNGRSRYSRSIMAINARFSFDSGVGS